MLTTEDRIELEHQGKPIERSLRKISLCEAKDHCLDLDSTEQKEDEEQNCKEKCYLEILASFL